jgi:hypothetical protein
VPTRNDDVAATHGAGLDDRVRVDGLRVRLRDSVKYTKLHLRADVGRDVTVERDRGDGRLAGVGRDDGLPRSPRPRRLKHAVHEHAEDALERRAARAADAERLGGSDVTKATITPSPAAISSTGAASWRSSTSRRPDRRSDRRSSVTPKL